MCPRYSWWWWWISSLVIPFCSPHAYSATYFTIQKVQINYLLLVNHVMLIIYVAQGDWIIILLFTGTFYVSHKRNTQPAHDVETTLYGRWNDFKTFNQHPYNVFLTSMCRLGRGIAHLELHKKVYFEDEEENNEKGVMWMSITPSLFLFN